MLGDEIGYWNQYQQWQPGGQGRGNGVAATANRRACKDNTIETNQSKDAIDKRKDEIYVPKFWWLVMVVIKVIPNFFFKKSSI